MKRHIYLATLLVAALALSGCSDIQEEDETKDAKDILISFTPMEIRTTDLSRGTTYDSKDYITSYGVSSSIYPAADTYASAACGSYWLNQEVEAATGNSCRYWPGPNYRVSFFAYAPYGHPTLTIRSGQDLGYPVYQYTVPSALASQADFITADIIDHSGMATREPVPLEFTHQCADIRLTVYNQDPNTIVLHTITLKGLKYSGTCTAGVWSLNEARNSLTENPFVLTYGNYIEPKETVDVTGKTNHFIMLPQTVPTGTEILDCDATVNGIRSHYFYSVPSDFELNKNTTYTFKLILGNGLLIVDPETEIEDWEIQNQYLELTNVTQNNNWSQKDVTSLKGETDDWETNEDVSTSVHTEDWTQPTADTETVNIENWEPEE